MLEYSRKKGESVMEKKMTLEKVPKGIEGTTIELEFVGNLDIAIEKMKWNAFCELDDSQISQLKCCLLFLCGMPFSKISEKLGLSKGTISRYLNDNLLEGLLSFEYRVLFHMNKNRLQPENKNSKIKRAVKVFIEQKGNYQKTSEITGFSDRTLSRYFSDSKLPEILESEQLYLEFCRVKDSHTSEIKRKAAISNIQQQSIRSLIAMLEPHGIIEKRYLSLCKAMLIEQINDIQGLIAYTGMSKKNIESYLLDVSKSEDFFPEPVLNQFQQMAFQITTDENDELLLDEYERAIIETYMSGRYSYGDMSEIFDLRNEKLIADIIGNKSKKLLSAEEYVALQNHKTEVAPLLQLPNANKYLIKNGKMISIVKPEFVFVESYDFQILTVLVNFLTIYENIQYSNPKEPLNIMETYLIANMSNFERLLTKEAYADLKQYLFVEKLLFGNELQKKYQYIILAVRQFFMNNFDLEKTAIDLNLKVESLIRVLQNEFVQMNYGQIIYEYVNQAIENYRCFNRKNKPKKIYVLGNKC